MVGLQEQRDKALKTILECEDLCFSYGGKKVLNHIDLSFKEGEFIALLGCNGAGKSTLLSCLSGLLPSAHKFLSLDGMAVKNASRMEIARSLSFVPQEHEDIFPYSVIDVVAMGRTVFHGSFSAPAEKDYEIVVNTLEELQIPHLVDRVYTSLSGGEKQLVLLARALVQSRRMIFLDEPTNHLDYKNRYNMLATLKNLSLRDRSCVVACLHDPNHALLFADRVLLLENGQIVREGRSADVLKSEVVAGLYGIACYREEGQPKRIDPAFVHPRAKGRVALLVGSSGAGKTTTLQGVIDAHLKIQFGGIINPGTWKNNKRDSSTARCLKTGEEALFCKRPDEGGPFVFYEAGQALAARALDAEVNRDSDCIIVDEVGPLELQGRGYAPLLPPILSLSCARHIWAVRPSIVDDVIQKWMLVDPVIIHVDDGDAQDKLNDFLQRKL